MIKIGMFDDITFAMPCPICQNALTDWQSKSGPCTLAQLNPAQLWTESSLKSVDWYENCDNCGTWVTVLLTPGTLLDKEFPTKTDRTGSTVANYVMGPDLKKAKAVEDSQ